MKLEQLEKDGYYHIYNRGINGTAIFTNDENKRYFLKLANNYLNGKVSCLAYCLMDNHYHMAVRIMGDEKEVIQAFSNLFNAYAKAFNKRMNRTGSLFEKHFKRIRIKDEPYLKNAIIYIHTNPQHHGIINDFSKFKFSSYHKFFTNIDEDMLLVDKTEVVRFFDGIDNMVYMHKTKIGTIDLNPDLHRFENFEVQNTSEKIAAMTDYTMKTKFYGYIQKLQDTITSKLEEVDGMGTFKEDIWERPEGGGGRTRVIENGAVFEKGGVNISGVHGALPESMKAYFGVQDADFFACGLSLVLHPKNPMVPTVHANWRYFEMYDKQGNIVDQWFGGGQDLTPYYLFDEDAVHFHATCKKACDPHDSSFYELYKKRCDDYFWNAHRNEARGIGGLFFDYCKATSDMDMEAWYEFVTTVGDSFLSSYVPIVLKRKDVPYTPAQREWQEIRRGRYVEFNLVHDKGTLFGLKTNGRIESILMSLPPHVQWRYYHQPEKDSAEERLLKVLRHPKEWL